MPIPKLTFIPGCIKLANLLDIRSLFAFCSSVPGIVADPTVVFSIGFLLRGSHSIILWTYAPGKWILFGSRSPCLTICSASTIQILPALAQSGFKFLAVQLKKQFPTVSTTFALIND